MTSRQVALVTGSATGIGRAAAWRFAELGYDVTVNYSKSSAEADETAQGVRDRGSRVLVYQANVGDESAVRSMVEATVSTFGNLDAAGISG